MLVATEEQKAYQKKYYKKNKFKIKEIKEDKKNKINLIRYEKYYREKAQDALAPILN